ncbi:response regulator [Chloroflexota bacterium]
MFEKILMVDDEDHVRESTLRLLKGKGYETEGAGSGAEALKKIAKKSYDLLLLDIRMPNMTGLELLRKIREIDPEAMALFLTGYGTIENTVEALELGALGFVRKPMPLDELADVIDDALARGRLRRENSRLKALMPIFEWSKVLLSEVDEDKILNLVLDAVVSETKADMAQVMLWDDAGNLVLKVSRGLSEAEVIGEIVADAMAVKAISTLEPVVVSSKEGNAPKAVDETQPKESGSKIYIPLIARGEAIGVLKVARLVDKAVFKQSDVEFLFTLCGQGAVAMANARLFESVQRKQAEVEELLKKVLNTTENERMKLSLELHDGPIQSIVASQYGVETIGILINKNELDKVEAKLYSTQQALAQSIHDLRRIVMDLHPSILNESGLASAVQDYLSNMEKDDWISCYLEVKGTIKRMEPNAERSIYYVVKEALNNIRKHAKAHEVHVVIDFQDGSLAIDVSDDGNGMDTSAKRGNTGMEHLGIDGMNERARMLNGSLVIQSKPGEGTRVKLVVPIDTIEAEENNVPEDNRTTKNQGGERK